MKNLLLFEWNLHLRNKRLKQQFFMLIVLFLWFSFMLTSPTMQEPTLYTEFFLIAMMSIFAQFAVAPIAINASFIEKQLTTPLSVFKIVQMKYYFFCILSLIPFLLFLPILFWNTIHFFDLFSTYLFVIGFMLFGSFYSSLFSYKPFEIKSSGFHNYQGMDKGNFLYPLFVMLLGIGSVVLIHWQFGEMAAVIFKAVVGLAFIATHKIWLAFIARKIEAKKYYRIERFRKK